MSKSHKGKIVSKETREKLSKFFTGKDFISDEAKQKISKIHKGKIVSKETKIKRSKSIKDMNEIVKCPHCGKIGKLTGMKSWHFDYCKENPNGLQRKLCSKKQI